MRIRIAPTARSSALGLLASLLLTPPAAAQYGGPGGPTTSVRGGPVGSEVVVSMLGGLAPGARVTLNFGGFSSYELVGRIEVNPEGGFTATFPVPSWAERNTIYFFFVNVGGGVRVFSDPFVVTGPQGAVEVMGVVSESREGCVVLTAPDDTRYSLSGLATPPAVGARASADGNLEADPGLPSASSCGGRAAIPIRVRTVRAG